MKYSIKFISPVNLAVGAGFIAFGAACLSVGTSYFLHGVGFRRVN